jgi:membrane protein
MKRDHFSYFPGLVLVRVLVRVWSKYQQQNIGLIAAGVAFYGLLSLFPAITALVAIAGLLTDPAILIDQGEQFATALPADARRIVFDQIGKVVNSDAGTLSTTVVLGLAIAIYSASRAVTSLIQGLNVAYGLVETRGFFALRARILLLTVCIIVGVVASLTLVAVLPALLGFLPWNLGIENTLLALRWLLLFVLAAISMSFLYRFGPAKKLASWQWFTTGSLVATALWLIGNVGFSAYVQSFGTYGEVFGALGGVIVLLTWMWLSAVILLLGALLDVEIVAEKQAA